MKDSQRNGENDKTLSVWKMVLKEIRIEGLFCLTLVTVFILENVVRPGNFKMAPTITDWSILATFLFAFLSDCLIPALHTLYTTLPLQKLIYQRPRAPDTLVHLGFLSRLQASCVPLTSLSSHL